MSEPFVGEIRLVSFNFAPRGWALCNGQVLSINQNQALFSLLGTQFGGDGRTTFALPNFQARAPMHRDRSPSHPVGEQRGSLYGRLTSVPAHGHPALGSVAGATTANPRDALLGAAQNYGAPGAGSPLPFHETLPAGGDDFGEAATHANLQPYLGLRFIIAMIGIFPSPT